MLSPEAGAEMAEAGPRTHLTRYERELEVVVDRTAARFAAWYEMFPRSQSGDPARHGTLDDVIAKLPYVRDMGFDVLYFTPIHPIGRRSLEEHTSELQSLMRISYADFGLKTTTTQLITQTLATIS